ncbi:MAG TPA: hypothetical protein VMU81_10320 [Acetobacteraceae bacterium]|jgi:hypothetical protein|nr:hypothetical protein [Acetobacteraceae bacterium]
MSMMLLPAAMAMAVGLALVPIHARAAGCLKGAVVGGVAGHVAGHHALLGAGAGCVIGHHEASKKQEREQQAKADSDRNK